MLRCIIILNALFLIVGAGSSMAADYNYKDSYYYMKDDGEFSDEEKDAEALQVYERCSSHEMQSTYFDCACIAGAFRLRRDDDEIIPQNTLINKLLTDRDSKCTNTAVIAGEAYKHCMDYSATFRQRKFNNEEYCTCVGNRVAKNFAKNPHLKSAFIVSLKTEAFTSCNTDP